MSPHHFWSRMVTKTHAVSSCSLASGFQGDPGIPHRRSWPWTAQCWVHGPPSGRPQVQPEFPHTSVSTLPGPEKQQIVSHCKEKGWPSKCWWSLSRPGHLVEVPLLLVQGGTGRVGSLHINHEVLHLILEPLLCLLKGSAFGVHGFYVLLGFLQMLGQLLPETLARRLRRVVWNRGKL